MATDLKYGRIEFPDAPWSTIEADEPVFVFRARDNLTPEVIKFYRMLCVQSKSPQHHLDLIDRGLRQVKAWQQSHEVKDPTSNDWLAAQTSDPVHNPNTEPLQTTNDAVITDVPSSEQRDRLDPTHEWYLTETNQDQATNAETSTNEETSDEEESYLPGSDAAHYVPPNPNNPQSIDFYEEDESATKIRNDFETGVQGKTQRIAPGDATENPTNPTYVQDPLDGLESR